MGSCGGLLNFLFTMDVFLFQAHRANQFREKKLAFKKGNIFRYDPCIEGLYWRVILDILVI
jgi:hypothetical protein